MPVRRVSHRGGNIIGKFPSLKLRRMVAFESLIERDYLYILDYEPDIEWFEEQPLTLEYQDDSKTRHYTPDFHLIQAGRNVLVECKPEGFIHREENQRKFRAAVGWCAEREWDFRVVTDTQLRAGHRLKNIKLMTYYARLRISPRVKEQIFMLLTTSLSRITIGEVTRALGSDHEAMALPVIMHMAFHHEVAIPLELASLSLESPIFLPIDPPHSSLEVQS